jgi:predicted HTH domain antitoxin
MLLAASDKELVKKQLPVVLFQQAYVRVSVLVVLEKGCGSMGLKLQIPDSVTRAIRLPEKRMEEDLLIELALALYAQDVLSFGKARELAGLSKYEFGQLLGKRSIPRHYGPEEIEDDLSYAHRQ